MSQYLLDTNICVYFMRGEHKVNEKIERVHWSNCFLSEITTLELLYGIERSSSTKKEKNKERLKQFLTKFENRIL